MNLIDFITYLRYRDKFTEFIEKEGLDPDAEELVIYMKDALSLTSEIRIFNIEGSEDKMKLQKDNVNYIQLFPMSLAIDAFDFLKLAGKSDIDAAKRLLEYREKDA